MQASNVNSIASELVSSRLDFWSGWLFDVWLNMTVVHVLGFKTELL